MFEFSSRARLPAIPLRKRGPRHKASDNRLWSPNSTQPPSFRREYRMFYSRRNPSLCPHQDRGRGLHGLCSLSKRRRPSPPIFMQPVPLRLLSRQSLSKRPPRRFSIHPVRRLLLWKTRYCLPHGRVGPLKPSRQCSRQNGSPRRLPTKLHPALVPRHRWRPMLLSSKRIRKT